MSRKQSMLDKISTKFFEILQKSFIGSFFTSYNKDNEKFATIGNKKPHSPKSLRTRILKSAENSTTLDKIRVGFTGFVRLRLRDYGFMLFIMGLMIVGAYLLSSRGLVTFLSVAFEDFVFSIAVMVVSIPLLASKKSLMQGIFASKMVSAIMFDFIGADEQDCSTIAEQESISNTTLSSVIGLALGVLAYFISPMAVISIALGLAYVYITIRTPEIGATIIVFLLPFVSSTVLCIGIAITLVAYLSKLFFGKRVCRLEYLDIFAIVVALTVVFFGVNYSAPLKSLPQLLQVVLILSAYFIFSNIIRNKEWFRRSIKMLVSSAIIVSLIGIVQSILEKLSGVIENLAVAFPDDGKVSSIFADPSILAQFLVIALPFTLAHLFSERKEMGKLGGFIMSGILVVALALTGSKLSWIGFLVGALLLLIFYNKNFIFALVAILIAVPLIYFAFPNHISEQILSLFGATKEGIALIFEQLLANLKLLIKSPLGNGLGADISEVMPGVTTKTMEIMETVFGVSLGNASHTVEYIDSLPLQMLFSFGVVVILAFALFAIVFSRLVFSYCIEAKNKYRKINGCAGICSFLGVFTMSIFSYTWLDIRMLLLCVICLSLSYAYIKIERNDMVDYEEISFASVDVEIELSQSDNVEIDNSNKYIHLPKKKQKSNVNAKEFENQENIVANELSRIQGTDEEE